MEKEEHKLDEEQNKMLTLKESEKQLLSKLDFFRSTINELENKIKEEDGSISLTQKNIDRLRKISKEILEEIENKNAAFKQLIDKNIASKNQIYKIQDSIINKLKGQKKEIEDAEEVANKLKSFFSKKMGTEEMVGKVLQERNELEQELKSLIQKAQAFRLVSNNKNVAKQIAELEDKFSRVEKKKNFFEMEIEKLSSLLKKGFKK